MLNVCDSTMDAIQFNSLLIHSNSEAIDKTFCGRRRRRCNGYVVNKPFILVTLNYSMLNDVRDLGTSGVFEEPPSIQM